MKMTRTERTRFVSSNYFQAWVHHPNLSQWSKNTNEPIQVSFDVVLGWEANNVAAPTVTPTQPQTQQKQAQGNQDRAPQKNSQGHGSDKPTVAKKSTGSPTKAPQNDNNKSHAPTQQQKPAFNFSEPASFPIPAMPTSNKPFLFSDSNVNTTPASTQTAKTEPKPTQPSPAPFPVPSFQPAPTPSAKASTAPAAPATPAAPTKASDDLGPCLGCGKPASSRCGRCKLASYCGATCQKAHWPTHKKTCGSTDNNNKSNANPPPKSADLVWYGNLDKKAVYKRFIDSYRLRLDDDYVWGGGNLHGLYAQEEPLPDFKKYLNKAKRAGVLPPWWKPENDNELIQMALNDDWANINYAVEKSDITDHYGYGEHFILRHIAQMICGDF